MSLLSAVLKAAGKADSPGLALGGKFHRAAARVTPIYHPYSFNPEMLGDAKVIGGRGFRDRGPEQVSAWLNDIDNMGSAGRQSVGGAYNPSTGIGAVFPNKKMNPVETSRHERSHGVVNQLASAFGPGEIAGMDVPALTKLAAVLDSASRRGGIGGVIGQQAYPFFDELQAHAAQKRGGLAALANMADYTFNPIKAKGYSGQHLRQGGLGSAVGHIGLAASPWLAAGGAAGKFIYDDFNRVSELNAERDALGESLRNGEVSLEEYMELARQLDDA